MLRIGEIYTTVSGHKVRIMRETSRERDGGSFVCYKYVLQTMEEIFCSEEDALFDIGKEFYWTYDGKFWPTKDSKFDLKQTLKYRRAK